jgi:hypothetical protein
MPGSLSFGVDKTLDVSTTITDLPTYKVINTLAPVFDLTTKVVIGSIIGQKQIIKDGNGNALGATYTYNVTFLPATNVKGVMSFVLVFTADQLVAGGESEVVGTYTGAIRSSVSSGVFLNENGTTTKIKDSSTIRKYYVDYPYGYANPVCNTQAPTKLNTREFIKIDTIDTPAWAIGSDPHELVCVENGKWNWLCQYQLISLPGDNNSVSTINGWYNVNGVDVPDSDAESSTILTNQNNVLAIGLSKYFNKGDKVKFGILSTNEDPNNTNLEVVVKTTPSPSGLSTPAVIITASRLY